MKSTSEGFDPAVLLHLLVSEDQYPELHNMCMALICRRRHLEGKSPGDRSRPAAWLLWGRPLGWSSQGCQGGLGSGTTCQGRGLVMGRHDEGRAPCNRQHLESMAHSSCCRHMHISRLAAQREEPQGCWGGTQRLDWGIQTGMGRGWGSPRLRLGWQGWVSNRGWPWG